ncbi:S1-C subfamily serine protease [Saccharopolyspora lacisalsi]|uniref:S1-C subfamily serine protease n=1 Tax=Halosaccharopolyspora lacisalsi TaxID=1000566 RepID=A0A839DRN9_9PSEU|nr:trypsin-like peptidase domain-containing protein [Halosaccharopolyspora lacisalsi]MBA8822946.1 S1-C subfamily serine protease [Halosaccharopolyspora lacisalsi]
MSDEQPRTSTQGSDSEDGVTGTNGTAASASPHSPTEPGPGSVRHPWQGGGRPSTRGVPAQPAAPPRQPPVDPAQSAAFGRPRGVAGSFAPRARDAAPADGVEQRPPPPEALAKAFGRPPDSDETLQRAPGEQPPGESSDRDESALWSERRDPWRDPAAAAVLGPPAQHEQADESAAEPGTGPLLNVREVLFGRRVRPRALAALAAVALLLGVAGGLVGRITAEEGNPLTDPDVTLAKVEPGADRPNGSVSTVASRVVPAVVSVEVQVGSTGGTGSGVVVDGNGYIVTNNHVVSMAVDTPNAEIYTVFNEGSRVPARIVGRDPKTDLAVLKVEVANPTVAQLGSSDDLAVGDEVVAIGSPLGLESTVTSGIVSSVHRPVRLAGEGTDTNAVIDAIQTDAAINPGNSGGPLVDGNGAVVGINSAIRTVGPGKGGSIGVGFAIPVDEVRRVAEQLIRTGEVRHAGLGVNAKSVTDGSTKGAQVQNVQRGSAAEAAGIAEGDVIIKVGDREVTGANELIVAVDEHRIGETVPVTVVRGGRELVVRAKLE